MIKLNLSNAYNLKEIGAEFNKSNIYLGYIKTRGYILIQETNDNAFINCIESNTEPDYLNVHWQQDTEEIKTIFSILEKILLRYLTKEEFNSVKIDVIDFLLSDLAFKFESFDFVKVADAPNDRMRELFSNPVGTFNKYKDREVLEIDVFNAKREKAKAKLTEDLTNIILEYNKNCAVYGYTDSTGTVAPLLTEKDIIKSVKQTIIESLGNPLLNLATGNGTLRQNRIEAINYLSEEFNIKGVSKNNTETLYYFDDNLNYFEELTEAKLKNKIVETFGITLLKDDYKTICDSIPTTDKEYNNILVFKNMLFDMDYMEELNFPICKYNRGNYLTSNLIGIENDANQIELLDFDNDFDFMDIYRTEPDPAKKMTFTEKTLRKILIPKDDKNNLTMFHDFLQRVGSCILGKNKYKVITFYRGDGGNGKGILKLVMELIFNRGAYSLTPATFTETFNLKGFTNRKCLLLDETDENDFNNLKPTLKRISSPESRIEQRGLYSDKNIVLNNFPILFIFSNDIINLKLDDVALFDRIDFLELPNTFVSKSQLNKKPNSYLVDRDTEKNIKADVKGLSWLITASIKSFVNMENNHSEYLLKQTAEETMDKLLKVDYLTKFIRLYTYKDETLSTAEFTTNEEIKQQYKQYMELQGKKVNLSDTQLSKKVGQTIKNVYKIKGKFSDSEMYYKVNNNTASYQIKLKSFDDLEQELKQVYVINENCSDKQFALLDYSSTNKLVYNKIQKGTNTVNLLNKALPDLDNYSIVKELLELNLIIRTTETNITDDL